MVYSIRMRSAQGGPHEKGGQHISGAERLVSLENLTKVSQEFLERALHHSKGRPDFINLQIDEIPDTSVVKVPALSIKTTEANSISEAHAMATSLLQNAPISDQAITAAFHQLRQNTEAISGAWLVQSDTGDVYPQTVRVSRMDAEREEDIHQHLQSHHCSSMHSREALILASKVLASPHIVGELCWSDDPDYTIGYVSYGNTYHRLSPMKDYGSPIGGRVFFITPHTPLEELITYLTSTPTWVTTKG